MDAIAWQNTPSYKTVQFLCAIWFNATGLTGSIFFATTFLNDCRLFITFGVATL